MRPRRPARSSGTRRSVRALLGAVLVTLLAPLALSGCSSLQGTGDLDYISGDGQIQQIETSERGDPIQLSGTTLEGDALDLADLRGKVVVVNVWWSECGPCVKEMPLLTQVAKDQAAVASFVGINIRDSSAENAIAFEKGVGDGAGVGYPSIYDPGGKALLAFQGDVSLINTPSTAVLDRAGRVAAVISGPISGQATFTDIIEQVAAEDG